MIVFLYIIAVFIAISIGLVLFKGYALIKELKDEIIKAGQKNSINDHNNSIQNQKQGLATPTIILDNKIYSQQEFFKEINKGKFQVSPMLQSKLREKNKK